MRTPGESKVLSLGFWCQAREWEREMSPKFPCATPGVLELPHSLFASKVWGVCNWLSQWWLIFGLLQVDATRYSGWCYSIKMIFCVFFFLSFFFVFTAAKEFSSMVRTQTLLNIQLLTAYSYNPMLTFDHSWFLLSFEE